MQQHPILKDIREADARLTDRFSNVLIVNPELNRKLVSFQANKKERGFRWYKYKEGFSAALMRHLFRHLKINSGRVLDPFAGSGAMLFVASEFGLNSVGIELLPNSTEIIEVRKLLENTNGERLSEAIAEFKARRIWETKGKIWQFPHLNITSGAFPEDTELTLGRYLFEVNQLKDSELSKVLRFAALCVLEAVSYTRKDGQYLRWDWRSGRRAGKRRFEKGPIIGFTEAITSKLDQICNDIRGENLLFDSLGIRDGELGEIQLLAGSCLDILPTIRVRSFDGIITSPPYCNRYDYTRTYALELAMLGIDEEKIKRLRQAMLSCTVENREKEGLDKVFQRKCFKEAEAAWLSQELLQLIIEYLEICRAEKTLNNSSIPRMVSNYFKEMALVIFDCARVLKTGAPFVMVNDNVRYQSIPIPVDLILSDFAEKAGYKVEVIWVLPRGKGSSSQQMGNYGRQEIRKCVYVWRKS